MFAKVHQPSNDSSFIQPLRFWWGRAIARIGRIIGRCVENSAVPKNRKALSFGLNFTRTNMPAECGWLWSPDFCPDSALTRKARVVYVLYERPPDQSHEGLALPGSPIWHFQEQHYRSVMEAFTIVILGSR